MIRTSDPIGDALRKHFEAMMMHSLRVKNGQLHPEDRERIECSFQRHMHGLGYRLREGWRLDVQLRDMRILEVHTVDSNGQHHDAMTPEAWEQ